MSTKKIGIICVAIAIVGLCVAILMSAGPTPPTLLEQSTKAAFTHTFVTNDGSYEVPIYVNDVNKPAFNAEFVFKSLSVEQINSVNGKFSKVLYSNDGSAIAGESVDGVAFSQVKGVTDKKAAVSVASAVLNSLGFSTDNCVALANNAGSQWGVELYPAIDGIPVVRAVNTPKAEAVPTPTPTPFGAPLPTPAPQSSTFERTTLRMYVAFDAEKGLVTAVLGQNISIQNAKKEEKTLISAQKAAEKYEEALEWYVPNSACARLCYAVTDGNLVPVWRIQEGLPEAETLAFDPDVLINAITGEIIQG